MAIQDVFQYTVKKNLKLEHPYSVDVMWFSKQAGGPSGWSWCIWQNNLPIKHMIGYRSRTKAQHAGELALITLLMENDHNT